MNIMKKVFLLISCFAIGVLVSVSAHENNAVSIVKYENGINYISKNDFNFIGTFWMYIDGNGTGMVAHFVSDNWVKFYAFSKNDGMNSEQDTYYTIEEEYLLTYKIDQSNRNIGEIWQVEGEWEELFGTFVISGNTMGFTNKKRTRNWTLKKTEYIPDCIRRQL